MDMILARFRFMNLDTLILAQLSEYWHSFLIICPISCLIFPYMICLLYFGANTI